MLLNRRKNAELFFRFSVLVVRFYFFKILGIKVIGDIPDVEKGYLIVSNHISHADPPLLGIICKKVYSLNARLYFLAKEELFQINKHYEEILHVLHAIPLKRSGLDINAIKKGMEILHSGASLVIFPEGTRNKTHDFLIGRPGAGFIALKTKATIIPIYLKNLNKNIFLQLLRIKRPVIVIGKPFYLPDVRANSKNSKRAVEMIMKEIGDLKKYV